MKLNDESRFPHPVLSADTGDYADGEFGVTLVVSEQVSRGDVTFDYDVKLTQSDLHHLVRSHGADVGVFINCRETYYSELIPLGLDAGRFTFPPGKLSGSVSVRPMVWTRRVVSPFSLANAHEEFGGGAIDFESGTILALGEESTISVGREKLAQMDPFLRSPRRTISPHQRFRFISASRRSRFLSPQTSMTRSTGCVISPRENRPC